MRIVLSRKGYDSKNGGYASPVFMDGSPDWNGRMFSLPIPEFKTDSEKKAVGFDVGRKKSDIRLPRGLEYRVSSPRGLDGDFHIHHDPDIRRWMHRQVPDTWAPVFGQRDRFATHLRGKCDEHIGTGTLFLFFGLFQFMVRDGESWIRMPKTEPFHAIWGYLQAKQVLCLDLDSMVSDRAVREYSWHPHCSKALRRSRKNTLYVADESPLVFDGKVLSVSSYGTFRFDESLVLTGKNPSGEMLTSSRWGLGSLPWLDAKNSNPHMSHHGDYSFTNDGYMQSAQIGQEFIVDDDASSAPATLEWLEGILQSLETRDWEGILE